MPLTFSRSPSACSPLYGVYSLLNSYFLIIVLLRRAYTRFRRSLSTSSAPVQTRQSPIDAEQSEVLHYMAELAVEAGDRVAAAADGAEAAIARPDGAHSNGFQTPALTEETRKMYTDALKFLEQHEKQMLDQFAKLVRHCHHLLIFLFPVRSRVRSQVL